MPRYRALRFYIILLRVAAVLWFAVGLTIWISIKVQYPHLPVIVGVFAVYLPSTTIVMPSDQALIWLVMEIAIIVMSCLGMWAGADFFAAHIDTATNTREMVVLLSQLVYRGQPSPSKSLNGMWDEQEPTALQAYIDRQKKR